MGGEGGINRRSKKTWHWKSTFFYCTDSDITAFHFVPGKSSITTDVKPSSRSLGLISNLISLVTRRSDVWKQQYFQPFSDLRVRQKSQLLMEPLRRTLWGSSMNRRTVLSDDGSSHVSNVVDEMYRWERRRVGGESLRRRRLLLPWQPWTQTSIQVDVLPLEPLTSTLHSPLLKDARNRGKCFRFSSHSRCSSVKRRRWVKGRTVSTRKWIYVSVWEFIGWAVLQSDGVTVYKALGGKQRAAFVLDDIRDFYNRLHLTFKLCRDKHKQLRSAEWSGRLAESEQNTVNI